MTDTKLYQFVYNEPDNDITCAQIVFVKALCRTDAIHKFVKFCGTGKSENDAISACLKQCNEMNFFDNKKAKRAKNLYTKMMLLNDGECFDAGEVYVNPANYIKFVNDNFEELCEFILDESHGQDDHTIFYVSEVNDIIE